ncbi:hypothetical protein [Treponema sp. R80B11-R83G3]
MISFYLNAAWNPIIPVYGRMQEIFGNEFQASGAAVRFGLLYNKIKWINPGVELSTSWYALNNDNINEKLTMQAGIIGVNIVARKLLPNKKMAVTLRAGGAVSFQIGEIYSEEYYYSTGGLVPLINIDVSFLWFAFKQLYLEAGFSFNHLINQNNFSGSLRPWLGIGWQF